MKPSRSSFLTLRGVRYHVRTWGSPQRRLLVLLHGWMDVSASFQFLVDALEEDWHCVAPDWRGFGLSGWNAEGYWFPDYLADLDALLERYSGDAPAAVVGHSMGGNIACLYAGVRPRRVSHVVSLEGFGLNPTRPQDAPSRYEQWLDQVKAPVTFSEYPSMDAVAERLKKNNPRLSDDKAWFLARHWAVPTDEGRARLRSDPKHKWVNPVLYRAEEAAACWRRIEAPVLWVLGADSSVAHWRQQQPEEFDRRSAAIRRLRVETLAGAGHLIHHDQPHALARLIEDFLRQ